MIFNAVGVSAIFAALLTAGVSEPAGGLQAPGETHQTSMQPKGMPSIKAGTSAAGQKTAFLKSSAAPEGPSQRKSKNITEDSSEKKLSESAALQPGEGAVDAVRLSESVGSSDKSLSSGSEKKSPPTAELTEKAQIQELCDALRPVEDVIFTVELPPDPPPKKIPKSRAARNRLRERQKQARARAERAELKRMKEAFILRQRAFQEKIFSLELPWASFSDLVEVDSYEEEVCDEYQAVLDSEETGSAAFTGTLFSGPTYEDPVSVDYPPQMFPRKIRKKRRVTHIRAVEISLGRVFSIFGEKVKIFDLDKLSIRLLPTEAGFRKGALGEALKRGNAFLKILWKPSKFETNACSCSQAGDYAVSADFVQAELLDLNGGTVLANFSVQSLPPKNIRSPTKPSKVSDDDVPPEH